MLTKNEVQWLKRNKFQIAGILAKLIEDRKNDMVAEEDDIKREKLRMWIKELKLGLSILKKAEEKKDKGDDEFTGI